MSVGEKGNDTKEAMGLNLKRAPSAGTVTSTNADNMWERSQSDANLSCHKATSSSEKVVVTNVSENPRVYWNLSCADQGEVSKIPSMNTSAIGAFQMGLETIHQHDEMYELGSSKESVSSISYYENNGSSGSGTTFMDQTKSSIDILSKTLSSSHQSDIRKSCSAIPTTFRPRFSGSGVDKSLTRDSEDLHPKSHSVSCDSSENFGSRDYVDRPAPLSLEALSSNYFCESDFDDSREQIPNYQTKLKALQDELVNLILLISVDRSSGFEWCSLDVVERQTQILSRCNDMLQQAWQMPNVGRDCATSLCDLIRQQGLLQYLTEAVSHAGQVVQSMTTTNIMKKEELLLSQSRRQFILIAAEFFSQILTTDNLDSILGLSSGNSTPKKDDCCELSRPDSVSKPVQLFREVVKQSWLVRTDMELNRAFISILEAMLKHHERTNRLVVQSGGLKSLIFSCRSTDNVTLRHVALALVNLGLFGDSDVQMTMAHYKVADWLFPLAFNNDDIIKYYACLAIVVLSAHKELTQIIQSSGTVELVFSFIKTHSPYHFAAQEPSHFQGRSATWLERLLPLLKSDSVEALTLASFHFVMEARIKQKQGKTQMFKDIGAIEVLRCTASSIHKMVAHFSRQALKILGVVPPFGLSHPVPIWSCEDVLNWLHHVGFQELVPRFRDLGIDGDILLTIDESLMNMDLNLTNGIVRLRLLREITKLKMRTTYETCDPSGVYDWLSDEVGPEYCQYTYALIKAGIDRKFLVHVTDEMLEKTCLMSNSVHRARILSAIEACKLRFQKESTFLSLSPLVPGASINATRTPPRRMSSDKPYPLSSSYDTSVLSNHAEETTFVDDRIHKNIDVFVSYRRSNGAQLASLIMVHLRLRGYRVFLDIERLPAGKFNENLLQSIQRSKNFIIVLTPNSLDRCFNDVTKKDWIHKEVVCALESKCNIIPITDRFVFPAEDNLPRDMKSIIKYNAVDWVHDYQDACVDKIEFFMKNPDCKCPFSPPQNRMSPLLEESSSCFVPSFLEDFIIY